MAHVVPNILPENLVVQRSVPIYGITQLGLRSHPTGSSTLSFIWSDKPVFNTAAFRPCYPTQAVARPIVSHIRNPYLTFPGGVHHFQRRLDPGRGRPHGDSQIELHINVLELRAVILALHHWATVLHFTGPSCFDCYREYHCCSLHQHARWDPFQPPAAAGSGSVSVATDSGHNSKSQTHSGNVIADQLSQPNQPIMKEWSLHPEVVNLIFRLWGTPVVDMFAKVHNTHHPQFICL